jgi:hypothetical protein
LFEPSPKIDSEKRAEQETKATQKSRQAKQQ